MDKRPSTINWQNKYLLLTLSLFFLFISSLSAEKYAGEIFKMGAGVRNYALGNIGVSDYSSISLAYWNPALLSKGEVTGIEIMHSEEFMGEVIYDTISATWGENYRYSLVISRIGINNIPLTRLPDPDQPASSNNQPYKYKSINNADYIAHIGLYRRLGSYVIGLSPKFAYRTLANTSGFGFGADIATFFEPHQHVLLGINVRDFFTTQLFWENGTNETVNPGADIELNLSFPNYLFSNRANLYIGTEIMTEGRKESATHNINDISFDYHAGLEIPLPDYAILYVGYDVRNLTTGLSFNLFQFQLNYAFKYNTSLDNSHRVSLAYFFQQVK